MGRQRALHLRSKNRERRRIGEGQQGRGLTNAKDFTLGFIMSSRIYMSSLPEMVISMPTPRERKEILHVQNGNQKK